MIRPGFIASLAAMTALLLPAAGFAQTGLVSADTSISQINAANNFGAIGTMSVSPTNLALVQFDLAALQSLGLTNDSIQKAYMIVYVNRVLAAGGLDFSPTNQAWLESSATYNNFNVGLVGAPFASNVPVQQSNVFLKIDVTDQVRDWLTGVVVNNGVIVRAAVAQPGTSVVLDSKESTSTSHAAFLDILLTGGGLPGPAGPQGIQGVQGIQGEVGPIGPTGPAGSTTTVFSFTGRSGTPVNPDTFVNLTTGTTNNTQSLVEVLMPTTCTMDSMRFELRINAGQPAHNYTFRLVRNGVDTALACSVAGVTGGSASCTNGTPVALVTGDRVSGRLTDTSVGVTPIGSSLFSVNCK